MKRRSGVVHNNVTVFLLLMQLSLLSTASISAAAVEEENNDSDNIQKRVVTAKMNLWSRGAFDLDDEEERLALLASRGGSLLEEYVAVQSLKLGPIRKARRGALQSHYHNNNAENNELWNRIRGGGVGVGDGEDVEQTIQRLGTKFGQEFLDAIEQNKKEHDEDCKKSCELFYCAAAAPTTGTATTSATGGASDVNETSVKSYSFGPVPPEDFAQNFGFPLDLIKVTDGKPLFSAEEAANVISVARGEGVDGNQYKSGKYRLGGDWLVNLPKTREWFNDRLERTFFPLMARLFPEIISSPSVLRAHSVSLLKYNSSHPRTDVHIDNGILALTLAMTPKNDYVGGGTFFEHMGTGNVLPMDVGHGTFRPGSVRHGGHKVEDGTRYILGAFLLIEDKVEHVRRLKNRGAELRRKQDLEGASKHFRWALELNPRCTTCLKDWAEILLTQKNYPQAEEKIRLALEYLEQKDSDALFTLGVLLSEQGRDDESIDAYQASLSLNADDAELCYNLGVKLGAKGRAKEEMKMYAKATQIDPKLGGAWLNWGTALAEAGEYDTAEVMFLKASKCGADVTAQALMNLGILYYQKAVSQGRPGGDLAQAKSFATKAAEYVDTAKPLLELSVNTGGGGGGDAGRYLQQHKPIRIGCHRLLGQIYGSTGDYGACEAELRSATVNFPEEPMVWQMLARILEVQGKAAAAQEAKDKLAILMGTAQ